jgi:hypothetical protein
MAWNPEVVMFGVVLLLLCLSTLLVFLLPDEQQEVRDQ